MRNCRGVLNGVDSPAAPPASDVGVMVAGPVDPPNCGASLHPYLAPAGPPTWRSLPRRVFAPTAAEWEWRLASKILTWVDSTLLQWCVPIGEGLVDEQEPAAGEA